MTRPAGGVVDFASGTFDTVKRATEVNDEFVRTRAARWRFSSILVIHSVPYLVRLIVHPLLPPRYIHPDGVVRYYDQQEAQGARMVRQMDKGRWEGALYAVRCALYAVRCTLYAVRCTLDHSSKSCFMDFRYARHCKLLPRLV